jgi:hypothetical protein
MKIKIKNNSDWVEGEKKILYEIYYNMVDGYYDDDVKEKEILNKLFDSIEIS